MVLAIEFYIFRNNFDFEKPYSNQNYKYIYRCINNKGVLELMKTYYELKHLSHLDNLFIT